MSDFTQSLAKRQTKKLDISKLHSYVCEGMKDYRTFKEDFLKLVEFAEWYKDYIA